VSARVLVAGVGNIFLGHDGFGVEVAARLARMSVPDGVEVVDFGIRSVHLAYQLLDGYDTLVLVDAVRRGDEPGTLSVIEPELEDTAADEGPLAVDAHGMDPTSVLQMVSGFGGRVERVLVVACEAERLVDEIGLSEPVTRAIPAAVDLVMGLLDDISSAQVEVGWGAGRPALRQ
jgi:hydrogenase maturation protease